MARLALLALLFAVPAWCGCASPSRRCPPDPCARRHVPLSPRTALAAAPLAHPSRPPPWTSGRVDALTFLLRRYDRDGDGVIGPGEYDRGEEAFARLDRNGDGRIDAEDFAAPDPVAVQATEHVLWTILRTDEEADAVTLDDVASAVARHDADQDLRLSESEVRAAFPGFPGSRGRSPVDPWPMMRDLLDTDGDGRVSIGELEAFLRPRLGEDAAWRRPERAARRGPRPGVPEGETAPDFTLRPARGGAAVTLSAFRGRKPVALVFGSYT